MLQSHTTDQPLALRGRVKERYQRHEIQNTTKVKQPALIQRDDCKTRKDTKYCRTKQGPNIEPRQTMETTGK